MSEAYTLGNKQRIYQRTATAMRISNLITIPSFVGMWLLATPISLMLYGTPNAGTSIAILAVGIFLLGIHQVTTGVLQGLGHTAIPVINMGVSAIVKIIMSWILTAIPALGIMGAAWATVVDFGVAALLNMFFVYRYVGFSLDIKDTLKALIASAVMGGVVLLSYDALMSYTLRNTLATLGSIIAGGTVFGIVLLLVGGVGARDIEQMPRIGGKLAAILIKLGLLRR